MAIGNPITLTNNIADKVVTLFATADQTLFTIPGGYLVGKLNVFRNGVKLTQSSDYTANDGTTVTLIEAANLDDTLQFQVFDYFAVADAITSQGGDISGNITVSGTITGGTFSGDGSGLTGVTGSGSGVVVQDDGSTVGTASTIDFGSNLSVSAISAGFVTVTASGGGGISSVFDDTTPQLGGTLDTNGNLIQFGDSGSATDDRLQFGDSQDLEIYHDGSNGYIENATGELYIRDTNASGTNRIFIQAKTGEDGIIAYEDGQVELFYDDSKKFETTSTGAVVTGILTATSFSGSGANLTGVLTATSFTGSGIGITGVSIAGIDTAGLTELNKLIVTGISTLTGEVVALADVHAEQGEIRAGRTVGAQFTGTIMSNDGQLTVVRTNTGNSNNVLLAYNPSYSPIRQFFVDKDFNATLTGDLTVNDIASVRHINSTGVVTATTFDGALKGLPQNEQTSAYTLVASDAGKNVAITTGGVTLNTGVFDAGDTVSIYNESAYTQMIDVGVGVSMRRVSVGNTAQSFGLNQYGLATIMCIRSDEYIISGAGVT